MIKLKTTNRERVKILVNLKLIWKLRKVFKFSKDNDKDKIINASIKNTTRLLIFADCYVSSYAWVGSKFNQTESILFLCVSFWVQLSQDWL